MPKPKKKPKPYRPANGTEGEYFQAEFCDRCKKEEGCEILSNAICYDIGDKDYPKEWVRDKEGHGTCTAFEKK